MSNELTTYQGGAVQRDYTSREVIDTIKQTVCKGATDAQLAMFIEVCKATGLNPWLKEIWFVPSVGVMAGRDGYLRVANEHSQFDGMETRVERDENGKPIKAVCSVWRKDRSHPITCEAYYSEYKKNSGVWQQYPSAMISKVSEVLALKRSFSINGVVTEEEVGEPEKTRAEKVEDAKAVAERKIAELKAAGEPVIDVTPEPPPPAPFEATDADVPKTLGGTSPEVPLESWKFKMLRGFSELKKELGEAEYYKTLGNHGLSKSNEITSQKTGRVIYMEMANILNRKRLGEQSDAAEPAVSK